METPSHPPENRAKRPGSPQEQTTMAQAAKPQTQTKPTPNPKPSVSAQQPQPRPGSVFTDYASI